MKIFVESCLVLKRSFPGSFIDILIFTIPFGMCLAMPIFGNFEIQKTSKSYQEYPEIEGLKS